MDVKRYLERIKVPGQITVDLDSLFCLQRNDLLNVPFENMDIHCGKKIELVTDLFYQKVVRDKRGGFCYELNGLFYKLLKNLGFQVKLVSGRVYLKDGIYGSEFDHLAIVATVDNKQYLVDVGFGKFSLEPLLLSIGVILEDKFGLFEFDRYGAGYLRVNIKREGDARPLYIFKDRERKLEDFKGMCNCHQTSPKSHFTKDKFISIVTSNGRITLTENQLKLTIGDAETTSAHRPDQFDDLLTQYFGIQI